MKRRDFIAGLQARLRGQLRRGRSRRHRPGISVFCSWACDLTGGRRSSSGWGYGIWGIPKDAMS